MVEEEFDIGAAFDAIEGTAEPAVVEGTADDGSEAIAEQFDDIEAAERARDEKGRFVKKDAPAEEAAQADDAPEHLLEETSEQKEGDEIPAPPDHTPQAIKDAWGDLPDAVREAFNLRERETHQLVTRVDRERQVGRSFDQVVQPYQQLIASEGGNPIAAVADLLQTAQMLRDPDPARRAHVLNLIATRFGIDIEQAYYSRPDPAVAQRDMQLMQQQAQIDNYRRAEQSQIDTTIQQQIADFAANAPHFDQVHGEMARLIEAGACSDLQSAYDLAIAANRDLRSASIEQAVQDRLAAEEASRAETVAKARRAAISPTSAPGTAKPPGSSVKLSPEEHIALDYDRIMAAHD